MATVSWRGGAPSVAQVQTFVFAGTWVIGEKITLTYGNMAWSYTIASATIATFLAALVTEHEALDATLYPAHAEQTAGGTSPNLTLTADTEGKPFTVTISTNSAAGTIDGGATSTGTASTASSGPEDVGIASNYSGGALPINGDTFLVAMEGARLRYNLEALSGVTLAVRRITAQDVEIGLPETNVDGTAYPEYRPTYFKVGVTTDTISTASDRVKLDYGTVQTAMTLLASGQGDEELAVCLLGTHVSNVFNVFGGEAGLATKAGSSLTFATLNAANGATVLCGTGVTVGTVNNYGASVGLNSAVGTALNHPAGADATTTIFGSGAVAQITAYGGTIDYQTTGTLGGNTVLGGSAELTFANDPRARTVTNAISCYSDQVAVRDPYQTVASLTLKWVQCQTGTMDMGFDTQYVRTLL